MSWKFSGDVKAAGELWDSLKGKTRDDLTLMEITNYHSCLVGSGWKFDKEEGVYKKGNKALPIVEAFREHLRETVLSVTVANPPK